MNFFIRENYHKHCNLLSFFFTNIFLYQKVVFFQIKRCFFLTTISPTISFTLNNKKFNFNLLQPLSISRQLDLTKQSNAFNLPEVKSETFSFEDLFIGDVLQGGSCNVDILSFCPHNLTHIECSSHILNQTLPETVSMADISLNHLQGLIYVIDLRAIVKDSKLILKEHLEKELAKINLPVTAIALKTPASDLEQNFDFSGKDFLALSKEAAEEINKFSFQGTKITTLILDLPSTDSENDDGKLLAHRTFFEIPETGITFKDTKKKVIVELAYFSEIDQNYYYFIMTPPKIKTNAIITDILFFPLMK